MQKLDLSPSNPRPGEDPPMADLERQSADPLNPYALASICCPLAAILSYFVIFELPDLFGFMPLGFFILGIVLGIVGMRRARSDRGIGSNMARSGLIANSAILILLLANGVISHVGMRGIYGPNGSYTREKCRQNLARLHESCVEYASTHQSAFPDKLDRLIATGNGSESNCVCPGTTDTPASGTTTAQILANFAVPGHCSYIYVGAGLTTTSPPDAIVAFEKFENHDKNGIHVLYANGKVKWLDAAAAKAFLAKQGGGK